MKMWRLERLLRDVILNCWFPWKVFTDLLTWFVDLAYFTDSFSCFFFPSVWVKTNLFWLHMSLKNYRWMPAAIRSSVTCLSTCCCGAPLRRSILILIYRLSPEKESCSHFKVTGYDGWGVPQRSQYHSKLKEQEKKKRLTCFN